MSTITFTLGTTVVTVSKIHSIMTLFRTFEWYKLKFDSALMTKKGPNAARTTLRLISDKF